MNVKQLKAELEKYPEDMEVFVSERVTDFTYGLVNSVGKKKINFSEDPDGEVEATDWVVVIDEQ